MTRSAGKVIQLSEVEFRTRLCRRVNGVKEQKVVHFKLNKVYPPEVAIKKAEEQREKMMKDYRLGLIFTEKELMLVEQVVPEFISSYRKTHSQETADNYESLLLKDFVPVVKNGKKIVDVSQEDLEAFNSRLLVNDPIERPHSRSAQEHKPLSGDTIKRSITCVCEFGHWCHTNGYMRSYPFDRTLLEKRTAQTAIPNYCTPKQYAELCKMLEESTVISNTERTLVGLCAMAGLRRGEAIGLCWKDWKGEFIRVRRAVESPVGRSPVVGNVKNHNEHDVYIPVQLQNILARHRAELDDYHPNNRILRGEKTKTYLNADMATDIVKEVVKKLIGDNDLYYEDITPHGLRHSYASAHNYIKTDMTTIKESLGHKNMSTTEIYTHTFDESKSEAADAMDKFISGKGIK